MFGSTVLEVAIGLVFVYSLLSLLCSTINEIIFAHFLALRGKTLESGIKNMLDDPQGNKLVNQLYEHPLIQGFSQPGKQKPRKPSYIPADVFVAALISIDSVKSFMDDPGVQNSPIPEALQLLIKKAGGNLIDMQKSLEQWYNQVMDRVSGWYKRKVVVIIFCIGLILTGALNIDTISFITNLSNDTAIRATIVSAAQGYTSTPQHTDLSLLEQNIEKFQPIMGWSLSTLPQNVWAWLVKIVGLLATALAISLGAPFWFDLLNRLVSLRTSGPPA